MVVSSTVFTTITSVFIISYHRIAVQHCAATWNRTWSESYKLKVFLSFFFSPRNLARWSGRHGHQCRMQVTWRIPAGLCWWLWQSALVLLPVFSSKGESCSPALRRSTLASAFVCAPSLATDVNWSCSTNHPTAISEMYFSMYLSIFWPLWFRAAQ